MDHSILINTVNQSWCAAVVH